MVILFNICSELIVVENQSLYIQHFMSKLSLYTLDIVVCQINSLQAWVVIEFLKYAPRYDPQIVS